jgi:CRISPR type I-E-associated protein CasB/Cse2
MNQRTTRNSEGAIARGWWKRVCSPEHGDPGVRARLRRCRNANEALLVPEAVSLARQLGVTPPGVAERNHRLRDALDLARILAHVRDDTGPAREHHLMRKLGWPSFPGDKREGEAAERPKMSEARFRRLLQTDGGEETVDAFTRLIHLAGGATDIAALADAVWRWTQPGSTIRQRWAFEYFNAGSASPETTSEPSQETVAR